MLGTQTSDVWNQIAAQSTDYIDRIFGQTDRKLLPWTDLVYGQIGNRKFIVTIFNATNTHMKCADRFTNVD